jgi:hypothetical protein
MHNVLLLKVHLGAESIDAVGLVEALDGQTGTEIAGLRSKKL